MNDTPDKAKREAELAQTYLQNYLDAQKPDYTDEELLELFAKAFPKRSIIDHLDMLFNSKKLRKNKKVESKAKYDKVANIGNPKPEGMTYGALPEGIVPEKKKK